MFTHHDDVPSSNRRPSSVEIHALAAHDGERLRTRLHLRIRMCQTCAASRSASERTGGEPGRTGTGSFIVRRPSRGPAATSVEAASLQDAGVSGSRCVKLSNDRDDARAPR